MVNWTLVEALEIAEKQIVAYRRALQKIADGSDDPKREARSALWNWAERSKSDVA